MYTTLITPERWNDMLAEDQKLYIEIWQFFRPKAGFWQTDLEARKAYKSFERYKALNPDLEVRRMFRYKLDAAKDEPIRVPEQFKKVKKSKPKAKPTPKPKERIVEKIVIEKVEKIVKVKEYVEVCKPLITLSAELSIYKEQLLSQPLGTQVKNGVKMAFVGIEELIKSHLPKRKNDSV